MWSGTAFDCSAGEISILHSSFVGIAGSCNNGAIIGRGVTLNGNQYTSHLDVVLSDELVGRTVTCSVDDGNLNLIGNMSLTINNTSEFGQHHGITKLLHHLSSVCACTADISFSDNFVCASLLYYAHVE